MCDDLKAKETSLLSLLQSKVDAIAFHDHIQLLGLRP
jgi:hypothetical protein